VERTVYQAAVLVSFGTVAPVLRAPMDNSKSLPLLIDLLSFSWYFYLTLWPLIWYSLTHVHIFCM